MLERDWLLIDFRLFAYEGEHFFEFVDEGVGGDVRNAMFRSMVRVQNELFLVMALITECHQFPAHLLPDF